MKLNGQWLFNCILMAIAFLFMLGILYAINISNMDLGFKIIYSLFAILICSIGLVSGYYELKDGKAYYILHDIPTSIFTEIKQFHNCIIFSYKEHAWVFYRDIEKLSQLKELKGIEYYNKKKECLGWTIIPYSVDLDKQIKDQNAPVAQ